MISDLPTARRPAAVAAVWATKEAICKAWGIGLRFPLPSLSTSTGLAGRDTGDLNCTWTLLDKDTALAAAWEEADVSPQRRDIQTLRLEGVALDDMIGNDVDAR
jgi:phosphopantetheinyl transferase